MSYDNNNPKWKRTIYVVSPEYIKLSTIIKHFETYGNVEKAVISNVLTANQNIFWFITFEKYEPCEKIFKKNLKKVIHEIKIGHNIIEILIFKYNKKRTHCSKGKHSCGICSKKWVDYYYYRKIPQKKISANKK
jgi:hypothetical protein